MGITKAKLEYKKAYMTKVMSRYKNFADDHIFRSNMKGRTEVNARARWREGGYTSMSQTYAPNLRGSFSGTEWTTNSKGQSVKKFISKQDESYWGKVGSPIRSYLFGDWEGLRRLPDEIRDIMIKAYDQGTQEAARELIALVKDCIRTGNPPDGVTWSWSDNYQEYHDKYISKVFPDAHKYYMSGMYLKSVGIFQRGSKNNTGYTLHIGVNSRSKNPSGFSVASYAAILEEGGGRGNGVTPKPLWAPSFLQWGRMNGGAGPERKLRSIIHKHMMRALDQAGIPYTKP